MSDPAGEMLGRIAAGSWLEPLGAGVQAAVGSLFDALGEQGRTVKDLLHGTTVLGHPLHPALTDVPLGAWTAGVVADCAAAVSDSVPGDAGRLAHQVGLASALASAAAGLTDHHELVGYERRLATLHGAAMTGAIVLSAASLLVRRRGERPSGLSLLLSTAGLGLAAAGSYVGGDTVYRFGIGVNRNAFAEEPTDFVELGRSEDFPDGEPKRVQAGAMPVLALRRGGSIHAVAETCSHAGGPLSEGTIEGDVVTCPWHGSQFCLANGQVMGGPATFPLPALEVRERNGVVEGRVANPLRPD